MRKLAALVLAGSLFLGTTGCIASKSKFRDMTYQEAIVDVKTIDQTEDYLLNYLHPAQDVFNYWNFEYMASFKKIHKKGKDDCDGGTLAAAALLSDNGYPSLMLCMWKEAGSKQPGGHVIFPYQKNGKWGSLGINPRDCEFSQYNSIEDMVKKHEFDRYKVINIKEKYPDWINNDINMAKDILNTDGLRSVTKTPK